MGRRGPKPEPAATKQAKGNPGHRPIGSDASAAEAAMGEASEKAVPAVSAPAWLKKDGLKVWERLALRLMAMKLLSPIDAEGFGRYCRNFARWSKMQKVLDEEGETYESESAHGKLKRAHPAFLISDRLERQLLAVEDRFGLNPAERQRLFAARAAQPVFPGELPFALPPASVSSKDGKARGQQPRPAHRDVRGGQPSPVGFLN